MPTYVVVTPIKPNAINKEHTFSNGTSIRHLRQVSKDILDLLRPVVAPHRLDEIAGARYWLRVERETEHPLPNGDQTLFPIAVNASRALQLVCPIGAKHVFIRLQRDVGGESPINAKVWDELHSTLIGRTASLEDNGIDEAFDQIYAGVQQAFDDGIVRLENPILFLERGMQIGNVYLATLMFAMGLDMLFMAVKKDNFVKRVSGFLGPDSFFFPPNQFTKAQPITRVKDVVADIFDLRNLIAHGQEIPQKPFRQPYQLTSTSGEALPDTYYPYTYAELLRESALFMLTNSLRKILMDQNRIRAVKDTKRWRAEMKQLESP